MVQLPLNEPITRRELLTEMMVVWLFVVLISTKTVDDGAGWRSLVLPVGALAILVLHVLALWRGTRASRG
jgi:hypothetical protein